ncbi:glycosyltransferase family 4 protein [Salipiger sp. PrR002]|uniref:glycosyltransferase family 4 protein n=1 Tax=Salipiger sp. PrR002 TaxID=2706489 RepID=UPI0013BBE5FE|nr:glycosyltransferase family 4 protein [Salipiger sp. PrR002]NDW01723.1 glycosyltransferase family 4 protein [Salipiger sp. PrR002]NDW59883.1 glycosyltransferase family 4 protein [Salipiger sp. PrR004]
MIGSSSSLPQKPGLAEPAAGQSLRICMIISSYHPIVGGAEKQVAQLAGLMTAQGHKVYILTRRYPGLAASETIDGVEVRRIAIRKPIKGVGFILGAARMVRKLNPDVIHCHSMFSPSLAGALGKRLTGAPLLSKPMCGGEATSIAQKPFGRQRLAYLGRMVDRFPMVSHEIEDELAGFGIPETKLRFIPNGVDGERFRPARTQVEKDTLRLRFGLPSGPLFLFAGRLAAQKRLPLLLEAWSDIRARIPQATLAIAGANRASGSGYQATFGEADEIPAALMQQPGVRMLGHVADMPNLLRAVDVFVLPSAREGLSNALLEACASGLACVTARTGGAMDFVVDGENGMLFDVDDRKALGAALEALAADPDLRGRLGVCALRTVARDYDIRQTARSLLGQYVELGAGARATGAGEA